MSNSSDPNIPRMQMEISHQNPDALHTLDEASRLTGVSRRSILIYYRAGLVRPVFVLPYEIMTFTEEAIHTINRVEHARVVHRLELVWIKTVFDLLDEVERLRNELRDLRHS